MIKKMENKTGGGTTNQPISGHTSNTGGIKDNFFKHNQISEDNKAIISSNENNERIQSHTHLGNHKRKQCNPSSDHFLNLNAVK